MMLLCYILVYAIFVNLVFKLLSAVEILLVKGRQPPTCMEDVNCDVEINNNNDDNNSTNMDNNNDNNNGLPLRNLMAMKVSEDRLGGSLQCSTGDPACRDPPVRGHHTVLIRRGFHPLWELPESGLNLTSYRLYGLHSCVFF